MHTCTILSNYSSRSLLCLPVALLRLEELREDLSEFLQVPYLVLGCWRSRYCHAFLDEMCGSPADLLSLFAVVVVVI